MESRFLGSIFFNKEMTESLQKLRIIKQNLIHVQGLPKSFVNIKKLKSERFFGQYGTIQNLILSRKINLENNKEIYSVYITYENKIEAACAISCVDSLLIYGKIIRAFFGTTKYCRYFLNSQKCPNPEKCMLLHQIASNEDIIIDDKTNFSYNEHLKLSKKIIEQSNLYIRNILSKPKRWKSCLPFLDFIFLNEEQKQNYFSSSDISYIKSSDDKSFDNSIKNNNIIVNNNKIINVYNKRIGINDSNISNKIIFIQSDDNKSNNNVNINNFNCFNPRHNVDTIKYQHPFELYSVFQDSIRHILLSKPYYSNVRNAPLKKMEFSYFKDELAKKGIDINFALEGCLDCIKDCL